MCFSTFIYVSLRFSFILFYLFFSYIFSASYKVRNYDFVIYLNFLSFLFYILFFVVIFIFTVFLFFLGGGVSAPCLNGVIMVLSLISVSFPFSSFSSSFPLFVIFILSFFWGESFSASYKWCNY